LALSDEARTGRPDVTWDEAESAKAGHGISGLLVRAKWTRLFVTHSYYSPQLALVQSILRRCFNLPRFPGSGAPEDFEFY
jgi:hypothetical protein